MIRHLLRALTLLSLTAPLYAQTDCAMDGYGYLWAGRYRMALEAFNLCMDSETNPQLHLQKGICYYEMHELEQALSELKQAKQSGLPQASLWLARTYALQQHPFNTINELQHYLQHTPQPQVKSIQKDSLFNPLHPTEAWLALWQQIPHSAEDETLNEARYQMRRNNYDNAHAILEHSMNQGLADQKLHESNAQIYLQEDNYQMALYEMNQALAIERNPEYLKQKADYLSRLGNYSQASTVLREVLALNPYDFNTRSLLAACAYKSGQYKAAQTELEKCKKYQTNPENELLAAQVYRAQGLYVDALRCINPVLEQDSTNNKALSVRGMLFYDTETYKRASYDLSMSLDLNPDDAETNYYMALAQWKLGRTQEACFFMKRARSYNEVEVQEWLQKNCR